MIYTICPRTNTGMFVQKFHIDCDIDFAALIAKHLFYDKSVTKVEIYEDRVPKGDCWGKPIHIVMP